MKITLHEALILAREKLPTSVHTELCFYDDEAMNNRIIYAIAKEAGVSKCAIWLVGFGMAAKFDDGKRMAEKALKAVDKI